MEARAISSVWDHLDGCLLAHGEHEQVGLRGPQSLC